MLVKKNQNQFIFWITASCLLFMLAVILFMPVLSSPVQAAADDAMEGLDTVGTQAGLVKSDIRLTIGKIIKVFLGILGIVFFVIILYAGYVYMTSGGDPTKVQTAKQWMTNATIGLIIIFAAYSIVSFILNALLNKDTGTYTITSTIPKGLGYSLSGNAFGEILSGHSPYPEQTGVPRNTMVVVTFKMPIEEKSFIDMDSSSAYTGCPEAITKCTNDDCPADSSVCGPINKNTFKLYRCDKMPDWPDGTPPSDCLNAQISDPENFEDIVPGFVLITEDRRSVVFNPYGNGVGSSNYLGSSEENVTYVVHMLSGANGIKRLSPAGMSVFSNPRDYYWRFTTSTAVDLTPPKIVSVIPVNQAGIDDKVTDSSLCTPGVDADCAVPKVFRNQIVVVNFNEPVLPLLGGTDQTACNATSDVNEAQLKLAAGEKVGTCTTSYVPGKWLTGINQYRTIQFISSMECEGVEENSCGEKAFCLPADKILEGLVKSAEIDEEAEIALLGTGIADLAGNALDGNNDGKADGQPDDNYDDWSFGVGSAIDLTPPAIVELIPKNVSENVEIDVPIRAIFNEGLDPATVDTEVYLYGQNYSSWFDPNLEIPAPPSTLMNTINMAHGLFAKVPEPAPGEPLPDGPVYMPVIKAQVRDMRQNCFTPSRNLDAQKTSTVQNESNLDCTDTDGDDITAETYGVSCCPSEGDYKPTRINPASPEDLNECVLSNIER